MNCIYITKKGTPCKFKKKMNDYCTRHHNIMKKHCEVQILTSNFNNLTIDNNTEIKELTNNINNLTIDPKFFNCEICNRQFDIKNKICNKCLYCHLIAPIENSYF